MFKIHRETKLINKQLTVFDYTLATIVICEGLNSVSCTGLKPRALVIMGEY